MLLFVVSALSLAGAFAVAVLTGCSQPSVTGLVELLTLPPLLVTNAFLLSAIACHANEGQDGGSDDDDGSGRHGTGLPERPTGGDHVDWEAFEANLRIYADRQVRAS